LSIFKASKLLLIRFICNQCTSDGSRSKFLDPGCTASHFFVVWVGSGLVSHLWVWKISFKNHKFFTKKSHWVIGSKKCPVKDRSASYLLRVKRVLGSGTIPTMHCYFIRLLNNNCGMIHQLLTFKFSILAFWLDGLLKKYLISCFSQGQSRLTDKNLETLFWVDVAFEEKKEGDKNLWNIPIFITLMVFIKLQLPKFYIFIL